MITVIRRATRGPVVKLVLLIVAIVMVAAFVVPSFFGDKRQAGPWLMKVNGITLTMQDYDRQFEQTRNQLSMYIWQLEQQLGPQGRQLAQQMLGNIDLEGQARHSLAERVLVGELADVLRIAVPEAVVKDTIEPQLQQMPGLVDGSGRVNVQMLKQLLGVSSLKEYEENIHNTLRNGQVTEFVLAGAYTPEFMLKNHYLKEFAQRNYGFVRISLDDFLKEEKAKALTDKEVKSFFDRKNRESKRYWIPEKRTATRWEFTPSTFGLKASEKEIERYYKNKKSSEFLTTPAQIELRQIVVPFDEKSPNDSRRAAQKTREEVVAAPDTFAAVAQRVSIDANSAKKGGRITPVSRDLSEKRLSQEAFALKKDSDISAPFKTDAGLVIIQRTGKTKAQYKSLAEVKPQIVKAIQDRKFSEGFPKLSRKVLRQYKDGAKDTLGKFAESRKASSKAVAQSADAVSDAHGAKLFGLKRDGDAVAYVDGDKGYIVRADTIAKSTEPALTTVKAAVVGDLQYDRARSTLEQRMNEAKQYGGEKLAEFAKKHGLRYQTTGLISLKDTGKLQDLSQKEGLPTQELAGLNRLGEVKASVSPKSGVVMTVLDQAPFDAAGYEGERASIVSSLHQEQKNLIQQGFIASLFRNATIDMNTKVGHNQRR